MTNSKIGADLTYFGIENGTSTGVNPPPTDLP
jgi:hypothetical protein